MRRKRKEDGQILVLVALGLVVLIGVLGLAIDMGYLRLMKRQIQAAADAGAIAGALELSSCGGGCSASIVTAGQTASSENGFADGVKGVTVNVSTSPTATPGDPYGADPEVVEVIVSQPEPIHFASIFGVHSATVIARADARVSSGSNCVYALNTLAVTLGTVNSNCGFVIEATLDCLGFITAPKIGVVGGSPCAGATTIATPRPADPLSYLPAPPVGPCGAAAGPNTYSGSHGQVIVGPGPPVTLNPGVYCGGIQVTGGTANFSPGTYILTSMGGPGGVNILGGTITGTDVVFYNTGTGGINISISALGSVNLAAPTSGPYEGVLFFQDPTDTQMGGFNISLAGSNLTGAYYFPNAAIQFLGTVDFGQNAAYTILDAQSISFLASIGFTIKSDYSSLPDGSPIKGGAILVE